jgi:phenylacetate-coenzyme A ligase PaaK-like adenylate-forming protein
MSLDARYWDRDFETRPWAWIESWQAQQLATMLDTLPQRSELYRDLLAGAGRRIGLRGYWVGRGRLPTIDMLESVPFTTKDDLRQAQEQSRPGRPLGPQQAVPQEYIVQVVSSAGTTGPPVLFALTRRDHKIWNDAIASSFWTAGIRPDDVIAHLVSLPAVAGGWPFADGLRRLGAAVVWLGGYSPEEVLTRLTMLRITAVLTTTSCGVHLSEQATAGRKAADIGIRKLLAFGEPGLSEPEIRRKISAGWGVSHIRDMMGLADVMANMWSECDDASGMHFNAGKYVIVELVHPESGDRVPWAEGARGEAVYTTFDRDATPVLRYRSADHLEVTGTRCACGRTSPKVRCIGRTDDMLVYRAMTVFPTAIRDVVLRRFGDVLEPHLRIWKEAADQVRFDQPIPLELEAKTGVDHDQWQVLAKRIGEAVREELQVLVAPVLMPSGTLPRGTYKTALVQVRPRIEPNGDGVRAQT